MMKLTRSTRFEVVRRLLAAVADHFIFDHLTLVERAQAGALDRGDMDEYISAPVLRLNESIAFRRVEPFDGASGHHGLLACTNLIAAARPSCNRPSEVSIAYGKAHREVRDKTRPNSNIGTVRGSRKRFNRSDRDKGRTPLDNRADRAHRHPIIGHNT